MVMLMSPPPGPVVALSWSAPQAAIPNATTAVMLMMVKTVRSVLISLPLVRNSDDPHTAVGHSAGSSYTLEENASLT